MSHKSKALQFSAEAYDVSVTGRNVQVTDSIKDYVIEKISKVDRFSDRIIEVSVILDIQKLDHRVDIIMKVDHIKIKSHANSTDMYASIDMAVNKLNTQLRRYKQRIQDHQAKKISVVDMAVKVIEQVIEDDINADIEEENRRQDESKYVFHPVVSKETIPLKILSDDEAIMKMELSGDAFLIFRQEEDRKLKVMYRRGDGNLALIEVQA
jgi:putative sigma-54 modulation protein